MCKARSSHRARRLKRDTDPLPTAFQRSLRGDCIAVLVHGYRPPVYVAAIHGIVAPTSAFAVAAAAAAAPNSCVLLVAPAWSAQVHAAVRAAGVVRHRRAPRLPYMTVTGAAPTAAALASTAPMPPPPVRSCCPMGMVVHNHENELGMMAFQSTLDDEHRVASRSKEPDAQHAAAAFAALNAAIGACMAADSAAFDTCGRRMRAERSAYHARNLAERLAAAPLALLPVPAGASRHAPPLLLPPSAAAPSWAPHTASAVLPVPAALGDALAAAPPVEGPALPPPFFAPHVARDADEIGGMLPVDCTAPAPRFLASRG